MISTTLLQLAWAADLKQKGPDYSSQALNLPNWRTVAGVVTAELAKQPLTAFEERSSN